MDTPHIYVACLAAYNSGFLHGAWIEAQDENTIQENIFSMLEKSPIEGAEEWEIHAYSGFGCARIDEYSSIDDVVKMAAFVVEHGDLGAALLEDYTIDDAEALLEESYHGSFDSEVDFAQSLFEDCYSQAIPDYLSCYFDHEAFARDLFINDYFSVEANEQTHVFSHR